MPTENLIGDVVVTLDPLQPGFQIVIKRLNKEGSMGIFQSTDGGRTLKSLLPAPTEKDRPGSTITIKADGSVGWVLDPSVEAAAALKAQGASGVRRNFEYIDFVLAGEVSLNATFGYFRVPKSAKYRLVELQAEIQAVGDTAIKIDLIDATGTLQNRGITLAAGERRTTSALPTAFPLEGATVWSAKVIACGTAAPGEYLTFRLVLEPI